MPAHTEIYTYFTFPTGQTNLFYSAESWIRVELQLETAGPVAVGTRQDLTPVLSGKGILLPPDGDKVEFIMPKGDRLYIVAEAVNRVKFIVEPIPWQEQILMAVEKGSSVLSGLPGAIMRALRPTPMSAAKDEPPCPPPPVVPNLRRR